MTQESCPVTSVEQVAANVYVLTFISEPIASRTVPGQFVNIKTDDGIEPLLRRPFSVYYIQNENVQIIFNIIGKGTDALRRKRPGDTIDVLGPLGSPFSLAKDEYDTAVLIAGGLGVAPMPLTTRELMRKGKRVVTFIGTRTASMLVDDHLHDVSIATDDGSRGFHGNAVDMVKQAFSRGWYPKARVFACGPTPMLRALQEFVLNNHIPCEASLEGPMGCGFGICQGCPVELVGAERRYALMCKDGPTFDMRKVKL